MKKYLFTLLALALFSCKPTQIITEKVETKVDSTAILFLQAELSKYATVNEELMANNIRIKNENMKLLAENLTHKIEYDTEGEVNPQTGEYPKKSEEKTESKYELEKAIKEIDILKQEHIIEIKKYEHQVSNLSAQVESLTKINSDLKSKEKPTFHLKSFLWGIITGLILVLIFFILRK